MKRLLLAAAAIAATTFASADDHADMSGSYTADPTHAYILFSYNHLGLSRPTVGFNSFDVALDYDAEMPENSEITVDIDATSIDSRVAKFNDHLNSDDFFNTAKYEEISFTSTAIEKHDDGSFKVMGDLTIKGITKPVTLDAEIVTKQHPMKGVPAIGVSATASLLRSDWDLGAYAPAVSDEVELRIQVEMLKD